MLKVALVVSSILIVVHCNIAYDRKRPRLNCNAVLCATAVCPNPAPPPKGQCCPVCPKPGPVDCGRVTCDKTFCPNPIPPSKGQCCPTCTFDCRVVRCAAPPCTDGRLVYPPGACCPICEQSARPCEHKGTTYQHGDKFWDDCNECTCTDGSASCTEKGCAPGCYKNGIHFIEGDKIPSTDPCEFCSCTQFNGQFRISCAIVDCARPTCANPVQVPGKCCPVCNGRPPCPDGSAPLANAICGGLTPFPNVCPEGYMCDLSAIPPGAFDFPGRCCKESARPCEHKGTTYQHGDKFWDDCNECTCTDGSALCTKKGCAPGCYKNGIHFIEGDKITSTDPCEFCSCTQFNGQFDIMCAIADCARPPCPNPVQVPGKCCPVCNGPPSPPMCLDGSSPLANRRCGGIAGRPCPSGYQCDTSNNPPGSADFFGICCQGPPSPPMCLDGSSPLANRRCGGIAGRPCPSGYQCDTSNNPPGSADFSGICCQGPPSPPMCLDGSSPLANRRCGGIAGNPCPSGYQCDTSNNPPGSADFFGICCQGPKCSDGSSPLENSFCGGFLGQVCPQGYQCDTSNIPPNVADFPGMCCRGGKNCAGVRCPPITCANPTIPKDGCCPVCPTDCNLVDCQDITCPVQYTPKGECCPVCRDCNNVACPAIYCRNTVKVPGECCPQCRDFPG